MNRKNAITAIGFLLGGTVLGVEAFLSGCTNPGKGTVIFTSNNISFLDEVGETILPATASSPGAKAVRIGEFMKSMVSDCYDEKNQKIFTDGMNELNERSNLKFSKNFMKLSGKEKHELLVMLDKEQQKYTKNARGNDMRHYFRMMKELTLLGYFTSEIGATRALRYIAVPGRYDGDIHYKKGDKAWAT